MKWRGLFALLLSLCLLAGCAQTPPPADPAPPDKTDAGAGDAAPTEPETPAGPQEGQFVFTRGSFPRLNGSTSTVPLGQAIASVLLGESREEVSDLIQFSKTTQSYRQLMNDMADLLIAAEPAEIIWAEKEEQGFAWEMEPFAVDGLVFIVNADNPVDNLTTEQVRKIYSGEITNWAEVGGEDLEIVPFQRNAEAGSQTAMLKLVMKDLPMMEAPAEYVRGEMGDLIESVAAYDGTAAAIGYTVYYYAEDMRMAEGLKILSIDGVTPNDDTIRSRDYPFLNNYYVLTAANLPEDAPAKVLYDWIMSEEGQRLVAHEGYVSVLDVTEPSETLSPVYADWSWLEPYQTAEPIFTYFEPYSGTETLQARDDYGPLLAYVGNVSSVSQYIVDKLPLYGLATADGRLVTEPVYADIYWVGPFLLLLRGEAQGYRETEWGRDLEGAFSYTAAAPDGSWVYELGDCYEVFQLERDRIAAMLSDGGVLVVDGGGNAVHHFSRELLEPHLGTDYQWSWDLGPTLTIHQDALAIRQYDDSEPDGEHIACYLDLASGEAVPEPPVGQVDLTGMAPDYPDSPEVEGYNYLEPITDAVTGKTYYYGSRWEGEDIHYDLLDETGTLAMPDCGLEELFVFQPFVRAGLVSTVEEDCFCYRSLSSGEAVFRYPLRSNSD